jgi:hypothetical protein
MPGRVFFFALFGLAVFWIGVYGGTYMNIRIQGIQNMLRPLPQITSKYRRLIREEDAPAWPLIVTYFCLPLGIVIIFAAIFLGK